MELRGGDPALGIDVSELECIKKIKISVLDQLDFGVFKLTLMLDDVLKYLYQLIFILVANRFHIA